MKGKAAMKGKKSGAPSPGNCDALPYSMLTQAQQVVELHNQPKKKERKVRRLVMKEVAAGVERGSEGTAHVIMDRTNAAKQRLAVAGAAMQKK